MWSNVLEVLREQSPWTLFSFGIVFSIVLMYIDLASTPGSKHFPMQGSYDMWFACIIELVAGAVAYSVGGSAWAIAVWFAAVIVSIPVLSVLGRKRDRQNAWMNDLLASR